MKISKYVFDNKEYYEHNLVTLNFEVANNNLELFLKNIIKQKSKKRSHTSHYYEVEPTTYQICGTSKTYIGKKVKVRVAAWVMCDIMKALGVKEYQDVYDNIKICRYDLINIK